jgi:hypothetical protein
MLPSTTGLLTQDMLSIGFRISVLLLLKSLMPFLKTRVASLSYRIFLRKDNKFLMILKNKLINMWKNGELMYIFIYSDLRDLH